MISVWLTRDTNGKVSKLGYPQQQLNQDNVLQTFDGSQLVIITSDASTTNIINECK